MSGKQKLIFHFACDGFFIASYCAVMLTHTKAGFFILFCAYWFYANLFFRKKPFPRLPGRELTTLETISWFAIGFSVLWIFGLVTYKGLQGNAAFMIPVGIIVFAIRSLFFARAFSALKTPAHPAN